MGRYDLPLAREQARIVAPLISLLLFYLIEEHLTNGRRENDTWESTQEFIEEELRGEVSADRR